MVRESGSRPRVTDRPEYRVPLMVDLAAPADDAPTMVSTFSGCGGSCLGFRLAGYRVLWASEFVAAARETYLANFPTTHVDERDIRTVSADAILASTGLEIGDLDVLEGSPPCSSFSMAGKRSRGWGEVSTYSDTEQRTDDLFDEYVRLVDGLRPRVFVAENVAGLARGVAKGYLKRTLAGMRSLGYAVDARVLDAQWLGVPQRRQRLIFVGVRSDLRLAPAFPKPLPYRYSIRDALPWLSGRKVDGRPDYRSRTALDLDEPYPTVLTEDTVRAVVTGGVETPLDEPAATVQTHGRPDTFSEFSIVGDGPSLDGYALGREYDRLQPGETSDVYFNLVRPHPDEPCPTVTQLGGSNPGVASVVHPTERRKFTIAELRRICGFPDDFILTGTFSQQWERLGRAVPPPMMRAVAETVRDELLRRV